MSTNLDELFESNRRWAAETERRAPGFFTKLLAQQAPQYLWIGCADSRVPANEILGLLPGDVFVHRNVANVVVHSDLNALSVIQFAIDMLKVQHIMVVGHYGCGGVRAAMMGLRIGLADNWIRHVQDVRHKHRAWLDGMADEELRLKALCELNVLEQSLNVCESTVVQDAWARGQSVVVHGWVYGLHNGLIEDLRMTVADAAGVAAAYGLALGAVKTRYDAIRKNGKP
ncbi:MAG: carbonate dehydratase [Piscinibacter sp.]|uniref:carbonate dehydratase n=1 Tax=Piscinibacter sp. TaxID=1903157 RepID=UPI00258492E4|nr:carbonate dehydratase [Piscinibacter sp.]MCW5665659.1 carbonate dehydratase [Piscinibacter sp.]